MEEEEEEDDDDDGDGEVHAHAHAQTSEKRHVQASARLFKSAYQIHKQHHNHISVCIYT